LIIRGALNKASIAAALGAARLGLPLLAPQAASAATQSATFNPVLIVDDASSSTGFTFSGFIGPVSGVTTTINLSKCGVSINSSTGACLGTSFSYNEEIRLQLQSPTGTIVNLVPFFALDGQIPGNTVTWTFADSASSVVSGNLLVSGTYLPSSPLSAFIGESGNGIWNLLFADGSLSDPLSINSWSLTVNQQEVPGPLPVLGAASAFGISRRLRCRIASSRAQS
jgi:Proprotein convertase P-domain